MSRFGYRHTGGDSVYRAYERRKREKRKEFIPLPPGPNDLTAQKIADRMSKIYVGDRIVFDSMKACITSNQCDRHSSYVKATGTVVEHCGGYVMVKLNRLLESVNYFDIEAVNGKRWPWYLKKDIYPTVEVMGTTWKK